MSALDEDIAELRIGIAGLRELPIMVGAVVELMKRLDEPRRSKRSRSVVEGVRVIITELRAAADMMEREMEKWTASERAPS